MCLVSALSYYEVTTFNSSKIHIAIPNKSKPSKIFPSIIKPESLILEALRFRSQPGQLTSITYLVPISFEGRIPTPNIVNGILIFMSLFPYPVELGTT